MNEEQVIKLSQQYLDKWKPDGISIEIVRNMKINAEGNSWIIPVRLLGTVPRRYHLIDALSDAEIDLVDTEHLDVLFVPVGSPD